MLIGAYPNDKLMGTLPTMIKFDDVDADGLKAVKWTTLHTAQAFVNFCEDKL